MVRNAPRLARALMRVHAAYRQTAEQLAALDTPTKAAASRCLRPPMRKSETSSISSTTTCTNSTPPPRSWRAGSAFPARSRAARTAHLENRLKVRVLLLEESNAPLFPEKHIPHRPLSRQGDGAEILMLRFANAMFEPLWNKHTSITSRSPSPRRSASRVAAAITTVRRAARHGAEPHAAVAVSGRDGAALLARGRRLARREAESAEVADADRRRQRSALTVRGQYRAGFAEGAPAPAYLHDIGEGGERHRNLRRAESRHRQLALGRRAVLSAHGQAAAAALFGDRGRLPPRAARDLRDRLRRHSRQSSRHSRAAGRGHQAVVDDQGSGAGRHAPAARAARHELRQGLFDAFARGLRALADGRDPRQRLAVHAARRGRGGVALHRSDPRGLERTSANRRVPTPRAPGARRPRSR